MAYAIIAEREVKSKGLELKKGVSSRIKKYRKNLKDCGIKFQEIFVPAGVEIPDALERLVPDFSRGNYYPNRPLYVFSWESGT